MGYRHRSCRVFLYFVAAILVLTGCAPQMQEQLKICPGKSSVSQSLSLLESRLENMVSLKANGRCRTRFFADGKKYDESFNVKLSINPPGEVYMQGDIFFNPKGIILGSNETEFWFLIKPELSTYSWGSWAEQNSLGNLMINPKTLLEALGFADISSEDDWFLANAGVFDVLSKEESGRITKKIYVSNCDYLVRKIEYLNVNGRVTTVAQLSKYKKVSENLFVPTAIKIISYTDDAESSDSVSFNLSSVKQASFTDRQRDRLFIRPQPKGFMHVLRSINGEMIEQQ